MSKTKTVTKATKTKTKAPAAPKLAQRGQPRKLGALKRDKEFGGNPCIHVRVVADVLQAYVRKHGDMRGAIQDLREYMTRSVK